MRGKVLAWALYDLANTAFSFNVLSVYFPLWAKAQGASDSALSLAFAASMLLVAFASPILGAVSDRGRRRVPMLAATTSACVLLTALLGWGPLPTALVLYAAANFFFQLGLVFYDALLPAVAGHADVGSVGGAGVGIGYLGSFLGLGAGALILAARPDRHALVFVATAAIFAAFAIPLFLFVREPPRAAPPLGNALRGLATTARDVLRLPGLGRFLAARFVYADAANTMILFMAVYATREAGFTEGGVQALLAAGIAAAVVGGFLFGRLVDRFGPKRVLEAVLVVWMATLALAVAVPVLGLPRAAFWGVALGSGLALGGTWAADRPLMLRLVPRERVGEFYGVYGLVGRFAAVLGPLAWGLVVDGLGWGRPAAVATLLAAIVMAALVLRGVRVPDPA